MERGTIAGKKVNIPPGDPQLLPPDLRVVWDGWMILHISRSRGMGVDPVKMTDIESYCRIYEVQHVKDFVFFVINMDSYFLEQVAKAN